MPCVVLCRYPCFVFACRCILVVVSLFRGLGNEWLCAFVSVLCVGYLPVVCVGWLALRICLGFRVRVSASGRCMSAFLCLGV